MFILFLNDSFSSVKTPASLQVYPINNRERYKMRFTFIYFVMMTHEANIKQNFGLHRRIPFGTNPHVLWLGLQNSQTR
jgi:hypothetical protein